jgi:type III secretion protein V
MALQLNEIVMPARHLDDAGDKRQALEAAIIEEVRSVAACLLDIRVVERNLADLGDEGFYPHLVTDLLEQFDTCALLEAFRELVREQCSIRDQRAILEALLATRDPWARVADPTSDSVSVEGMLMASRLALAPQLRAQYARHAKSIPAFLVDPGLAARVAGSSTPSLSGDERLRFLTAVHDARTKHLHVGGSPIILTDDIARLRVRRLIEVEFPDLPVLARQELEPDIRIQSLTTLHV